MQNATMEIGLVYFYTATILNWKNLLIMDKYKDTIMNSLKYLVKNGKVKIYGFVIMPNHVHLIWEMLEKNGKELPSASLMKFTGHIFLKDLQESHPQVLAQFVVNTSTREHHFWQRNSLPILLYTPEVLQQKLEYIHQNPLQEKCKLTEIPENYKYSSANFYETGIDEFDILTHWRD